MSAEPEHTVTSTVQHHPWFEEDKSFITEVWEYDSFDMEGAIIRKAVNNGWQVYLIGNDRPGMVVYKKITT